MNSTDDSRQLTFPWGCGCGRYIATIPPCGVELMEHICPRHRRGPDPVLASRSARSFVGTLVQCGFPTGARGRVVEEHMWVHVTDYESGTLVGTLENHSLHTRFNYGDLVRVPVWRVLAVRDGAPASRRLNQELALH
jgi:hypothetical protein